MRLLVPLTLLIAFTTAAPIAAPKQVDPPSAVTGRDALPNAAPKRLPPPNFLNKKNRREILPDWPEWGKREEVPQSKREEDPNSKREEVPQSRREEVPQSKREEVPQSK